MAEIVNLRQRRKALEREARERQAAENRRLFGRPKAERRVEEARRTTEAERHEGHRLGSGPDNEMPDEKPPER
ncbi:MULTISPECIES: DUF4169 family protein [Methylobacterium]|uniref:DUF4169 domain-containing protein n=1 Tax=Methylobacterium jeotgali TaxID=381630 RepID=A0ABQ4SUW9_9HYPH|nr:MULTISPECIES: DUF4169 family protein [Methylobacterium]PIU06111.1 MAG: DUF4169 domain-containing protein [Methylobacterium sp. CG09_land_8_20_14_0_10_71_15]PIU14661.1 MAG: DUF4169 domain-containing protein [Methylobacterium sp. CG08_land_8_20_14_0_20_71_15]GBU18133.1 hypothetical protein AwMethylo_23480 [Methylobacterium sp.]GJE06986.1 hypothetical protein AOPFMNJM_2309 [Methylobacterium jeotgali]